MERYLENTNWLERAGKLEGKKCVLYGAGKYGKIALKNIQKYLPQLEVICFLDDNKIRNNEKIDGLEVLSLNEALEKISGEFNILITNYYVLSVMKKIENCKFNIDRVFFVPELLIEDIDNAFLKANKDNLQKAFNYLDDYQSKIIFQCMIEARYTKKLDLLSRTCQRNQYFPEDIFSLNTDEVFVDGGAYDGDTIRQFLKETKHKYKYIYAFEPDSENYKRLKKKNMDKNILAYNAGLWEETAEISFSSNKGGSSTVEEKGEDSIQVYKFDEIKLPDDKVTFIKMDIEGSELKALKGMEKTIKRCKPKLAICIYHKIEDLWQLPLYINQLVPEYKLYIRNYTTYLDEIVLYAVP